MEIAVIGTGYVGLVTAVCMAEKGHQVTCIDIDKKKIEQLNQGIMPIYENGLDELMRRNSARLTYTTKDSVIYDTAEVIFIGVGTPEKKDGSANLTYVYQAAKRIAENARRDCIVVIKSTVPIGTNNKIEIMMNQVKRQDVTIDIVSNPEFLSQGAAINDTLHASRIVLGVSSQKAKNTMLELYSRFDAPKIVTDRSSAEMIKYAANDFLALKISYINEIANLCEEIGANIDAVAAGMGYDERIGDKFLKAGIGYGGSCFPKDTKALHWLSSFHDHEIKTVKAAIEVNENQKLKLIKKAKKYYDSFDGLTIAVLGLTFKPGTDDIREAPSLVNIPIFLDDGATVKAYDPIGEENFRKQFPKEVHYCKTIDETINGTDLCFIFTEWEAIKKYDLTQFKKRMKRAIILDGRNCFEAKQIGAHCEVYESIGRKAISRYTI